MKQKLEINIKNEQGFVTWLMTEKGLSEKWGRNTSWYVNRLLTREDRPFPEKKDADALAFKILKSDYSKSHQQNTIKAIEHYMEYIGKSMKFKKPTKGKRLPRYLTREELRKLFTFSKIN